MSRGWLFMPAERKRCSQSRLPPSSYLSVAASTKNPSSPKSAERPVTSTLPAPSTAIALADALSLGPDRPYERAQICRPESSYLTVAKLEETSSRYENPQTTTQPSPSARSCSSSQYEYEPLKSATQSW